MSLTSNNRRSGIDVRRSGRCAIGGPIVREPLSASAGGRPYSALIRPPKEPRRRAAQFIGAFHLRDAARDDGAARRGTERPSPGMPVACANYHQRLSSPFGRCRKTCGPEPKGAGFASSMGPRSTTVRRFTIGATRFSPRRRSVKGAPGLEASTRVASPWSDQEDVVPEYFEPRSS